LKLVSNVLIYFVSAATSSEAVDLSSSETIFAIFKNSIELLM